MDLSKAIQGRKSIRKFSDKKPDWRDLIECIDSMRYVPMSGGIFSVKAILVDEKEKIKSIAEAAQQDFISQAHYVLVVYSVKTRTLTSFGKKGEIYLRQQAGAAIENFLLKIQEKNLATCWVGHFSESHIKKELKIPDDANVEAIFPIGYASKISGTKKRRKIDLENVLYFNRYGNKRMK